MRIRKRVSADLSQVVQLLGREDLPPDGLEKTEGWVLELEGKVIGHIAVEPTPDARVLRSLVVAPEHRGRGLGGQLMQEAERHADGLPLVLRTKTIGPWVESLGYSLKTLGEVPPSVRATTQFSGELCSGTPVYMKATAGESMKLAIRERYAGFVKRNSGCCGPASQGCGCSMGLEEPSLKVGYAKEEIEAAPSGANLGLGCGNPVALASLRPGETVLDLGSGAGFDAFLASPRVGPSGRVLGVDMTPEMVERARALAERHGYGNVEFRLGDIEQLPVEDAAVDAIISNCVINLTSDKVRAFREAFRALRPGGRLMVSDMVLLKPLPDDITGDPEAYAACIGGALLKADYLAAIQAAGFTGVQVVGESSYDLGDGGPAEGSVVSVQIQALKPEHGEIRPVRIEDAPALAAIYNPYIADTVISFEESPVTVHEMEARIRKVTADYPWIVWEQGGKVIGYAYASSWRSRQAYRFTAETSIYVDRDQHRLGIGEALYRALIRAMRERGFHSALGCLSLPNDPSVAMHEKLGFVKVAHMKEAGRKFDRWVDVGFWERML